MVEPLMKPPAGREATVIVGADVSSAATETVTHELTYGRHLLKLFMNCNIIKNAKCIIPQAIEKLYRILIVKTGRLD
ncbi:Hypothetical protein NTJ_02502 [Nesidiocoris tenuis]|uniref:Uncharacterized protein n=1 Tax=Nesidiocoris tenuis TaxID=355587 RepID=A0ABN7ABJ7_9HEMI|nr:Hypothetical protein NTJ_02502 [Nesidiocoris tenuis]